MTTRLVSALIILSLAALAICRSPLVTVPHSYVVGNNHSGVTESEFCASPSPLVIQGNTGGTSSGTLSLSLQGTQTVMISNITISSSNSSTNASAGAVTSFSIDFGALSVPFEVSAGLTRNISVNFTAPASMTAPIFAEVVIVGEDDSFTLRVPISGVTTKASEEQNKEPSLQYSLTAYGIPITTGDDDPLTVIIHSKAATGKAAILGPDEVSVQQFQAASNDPVTVQVLGAFGPDTKDPVVSFGWYKIGQTNVSDIFSVPNTPGNAHRFNPLINGTRSFHPGVNVTFGFAHTWTSFSKTYRSEDNKNFDNLRHIRVYPLFTGSSVGTRVLVPDSYVLAMEDYDRQWPFDYNDLMVVVRNVRPTNSTTPKRDVESVQALDNESAIFAALESSCVTIAEPEVPVAAPIDEPSPSPVALEDEPAEVPVALQAPSAGTVTLVSFGIMIVPLLAFIAM